MALCSPTRDGDEGDLGRGAAAGRCVDVSSIHSIYLAYICIYLAYI